MMLPSLLYGPYWLMLGQWDNKHIAIACVLTVMNYLHRLVPHLQRGQGPDTGGREIGLEALHAQERIRVADCGK
jgi:hypothetical protein